MMVVAVGFALMPETVGREFWILVTIFVIASATQDIAIDAFTIRITPKEMLGPVNSIRVTAYRIAIIAGGGGLAAVGGRFGWSSAFGTGAALFAIVLIIALWLPDDRGERAKRQSLFRDLAEWARRPRAAVLLTIVFLYRLGELAIVTMIKPYWVDRGYSPAEIGTITTVVGVTVSVAGVLAGGAIVARFGLYRALLWLGIAQTMSNLGYALVATIHAGRKDVNVDLIKQLDIDRVPDPKGQVRALITADDCVRLLDLGFEVRLHHAHPIRPLDPTLIETNESVRRLLDEKLKGLVPANTTWDI